MDEWKSVTDPHGLKTRRIGTTATLVANERRDYADHDADDNLEGISRES